MSYFGDLWNGNDDAAEERRTREARMQRGKSSLAGSYGSQGVNPMDGAMAFAAKGFQQHADAAGQINKEIGDEMDSRAAQTREIRRMEHERAMKQMELDAILARLAAVSKSRPADGPAPRASFPGGAIY